MSDSQYSESVPALPDSPTLRPRSGNRRPKKGNAFLRFLRDVVVILLAAIVISFLIKTFLIRSFYIPSESMEPTLDINDRIIVNELEPALMPIQHGDVVVFKDPGGWLPPQPPALQHDAITTAWNGFLEFIGLVAPDDNDHLVKRVIGLPGDHVQCCNALGQMSINGVPLNEPYLQLPPDTTRVSANDFDVVVPPNSLWVMGDNRYESADSRLNRDKPGNGFVPISNVVGRAIIISWPSSRWSWLDNHSFVFASVPEPQPSDTPAPTTTSGQ